jgi:hypothetical protein
MLTVLMVMAQGILTTAREKPSTFESPLLSMSFRKAQLGEELADIERWAASQRKMVATEVDSMNAGGAAENKAAAEVYATERLEMVSQIERKKRRGAYQVSQA